MSGCPQVDRREVLVLMRRLRDMRDEECLECLVAYHAAPTLGGIKPASLLCPYRPGRKLDAALAACAPRLRRIFGVEMAEFRNRGGALLLLVYNPLLLRRVLAEREATDLLAEFGYEPPAAEASGMAALFERLRRRCAGPGFPHEIGLLLGYPPRDVRLFMGADRGAGMGPIGLGWQAYGDVEASRRLADRFRAAKRLAAGLILAGADSATLASAIRNGFARRRGVAA